MEFPDIFKLEKLKIEAYLDSDRGKSAGDPFEAMFNPETLSREYGFSYRVPPDVNKGKQSPEIAYSPPGSLKIKLLLDGSGVTEMGFRNILAPPKSVDEQIAKFLALTYQTEGKSHRPNFLRLRYGLFSFDCRLGKVTVTQQAFDRQGKTARAELDLELISDESIPEKLRNIHYTSPDVSHTLTVRAGDTLPLLTEQVYESDRHHLAVARFNGLDHLRSVDPGVILRFPPLAR
ncbi:MAG: hypothetical protein O9273_11230 [Acetobacteraceae bacterium]|nr:hypothetical protein [Acetobacteraceae bacterium]